MTHQVRLCCAWSVLFFFLFTLFAPDDALCDWEDNLKTAAIVSGITLGVGLIVVLVVGTLRDMKRDKDEEDEDDDVWSGSPVLRTLGYRPMDDPLFGRSPVHPEGFAGRQKLEAFLEGKVDRVRLESPNCPRGPDSRDFSLGGVPAGLPSHILQLAGTRNRPPSRYGRQ